MQLVSTLLSRLQALVHPKVIKRSSQIGRTIIQDLVRCDLLRQASAMAYVTLLSLVPSLVAVFCVVSLFSPLVEGHASLVDKAREFILTNLATGSGESVVKYLDQMLKDLNLAKIGWSSFASVLVTLILLLRQIEEALNKIWLIRRSRNLFARFVYFWSFLTLGLLVLGIGLGASSGFDLERIFNWNTVSETRNQFDWIWSLGGASLFFFSLYKVVPNCKVNGWSAAFAGIVAAILLQTSGRLYGLYVKDVKNYQTLYGALAQLPVFLFWLYICWVVILLGALVSWRLQEGFPASEEESTFTSKTPADEWRDAQVKSVLPLITMLTVYKAFESAHGRGLTAHVLAHRLEVPMPWVSESLDVLVGLGYVVASQSSSPLSANGDEEEYFPRMPAASVPLAKIRQDFLKPFMDILAHWDRTWALNLKSVLEPIFSSWAESSAAPGNMTDVLKIMPEIQMA